MAETTDLTALESALLAEIGAAGDLDAIERVRIAALGKKGRVPELMAQARHAAGRSAQGVRAGRQRPQDARQRRAGSAQGGPGARRAHRAPRRREGRRHAAGAARAAAGRAHPSRQPGVGRGGRDLRRHGLRRRRGARHRDRRPQLHQAQHPARAPRPAGARHLLHEGLRQGGRQRPRQGAAHAHEPRADPHHDGAEAADPHHRAGPRLPHGQRRHAHADVPPDRRRW